MDYFLKLFLSGTAKGSIYALIALGYTMVYGIIKLINFAHGEIYMIGAFSALITGGALHMAACTDSAAGLSCRCYHVGQLRLYYGKNCL